jgi:plastocyanin
MFSPKLIATALLLSLLGTARCQSSKSGSSSTSSTSRSTSSSTSSSAYTAQTHVVQVGTDGFSYIPNTVYANVTDVIAFHFFPQNHSVARAEYLIPCIPYEYTGSGKVGFWSGFEPVNTSSENGPVFYLTVNSTQPVFFYCSADGACVPNAMVGVINPNATQTIDAQIAAAKQAKTQVSPGEPIPAESTASATPSSTAVPASPSGSGLSGGAIAGIVVGAIVVVALAALTIYLCGRNHSLQSILRYSHPPPKAGNTIPPVPYSPSATPYSPGFDPKAPLPSPGAPAHESWISNGAPSTFRSMSPEMAQQQGNQYSPGFNNGYNAVDNPANPASSNYHIQSSPGETPWNPHGFPPGQTQYASVPQNHEMSAEADGTPIRETHVATSPGLREERASYLAANRAPQEVHELDARSSVPETPFEPPEYRERTFSFAQGGDAPPGVEKVLRD